MQGSLIIGKTYKRLCQKHSMSTTDKFLSMQSTTTDKLLSLVIKHNTHQDGDTGFNFNRKGKCEVGGVQRILSDILGTMG